MKTNLKIILITIGMLLLFLIIISLIFRKVDENQYRTFSASYKIAVIHTNGIRDTINYKFDGSSYISDKTPPRLYLDIINGKSVILVHEDLYGKPTIVASEISSFEVLFSLITETGTY